MRTWASLRIGESTSGTLWRRLALPKRIENWSLTSLQQRLVKTGGRLVKTCARLLATVGGRASDAAAVRGDAGLERAATATAVIALGEVSRAESSCGGAGVSRGCACSRLCIISYSGCRGIWVESAPSGFRSDGLVWTMECGLCRSVLIGSVRWLRPVWHRGGCISISAARSGGE